MPRSSACRARLGHAIGNAFKVLNRIEYSAPWASQAKRRPVQLIPNEEGGLARTALLAYSARSFRISLE